MIFCLAAVGIISLPQAAMAEPVSLNIKIIHAHSGSRVVDPRLKELARQFSKLSFTAYELKDEASLHLELGSSGRMQTPTGQWLEVRAKEIAPDGKLRLELIVEKLKFKTTVSIAEGATLAVGGPPYEGGALIFAVTRPKPKPEPRSGALGEK